MRLEVQNQLAELYKKTGNTAGLENLQTRIEQLQHRLKELEQFDA